MSDGDYVRLEMCATCGHRFKEGDQMQAVSDEYELHYVCLSEHSEATQ